MRDWYSENLEESDQKRELLFVLRKTVLGVHAYRCAAASLAAALAARRLAVRAARTRVEARRAEGLVCAMAAWAMAA